MRSPILVVDDEPGNLALIRVILGAEHPLVFARSGREALDAAEKHRPALILMDIRMPDMDGYTTCRKLKAQESTEDIPVIFVTDLADTGDETAGFAAGGVDYIVKPVSPPVVRARVRTHLSLVSAKQLERSYHDAIFMLGEASEFKDADTGAHIWRMASYSSTLAEICSLDAGLCKQLLLAAPLHDIGKLGIPDAILNKPGELDEQEREVMRSHTLIGHQILLQTQAPILRMAASIALNHHEWWNGGGYPNRLRETEIPQIARVVAIADVFDALSMSRSYKEGWPLERVITAIRTGAGIQFDPEIVEAFMDNLGRILEIREAWLDGRLKREVVVSSPVIDLAALHNASSISAFELIA